MLERVLEQRGLMAEHDLSFLADTPVCFHCHHFNLFLDQTVDDALGSNLGTGLRMAASREAYRQLLSNLVGRVGAQTPAERLELAQALFAATGQGRLTISGDPTGGKAVGEYLHYGYGWIDKYGSTVRRKRPVDAVAGGFAAAALEVAFDMPAESVRSEETQCYAQREDRCEFELTPGDPLRRAAPVGRDESEAIVKPTFTGQHEDRITTIAGGLRDFAGGVFGDERGLVQAFGVFVTLHMTSYYNRISYDAVRRVRERAPQSVGVLEDLLRESGHVCVFNTFGGILLSPEWEAMVGPIRRNIEEIVSGCVAIARALGFGHWTIQALHPGEHLTLRTPSTYETPYYCTREGKADAGACYFLQGAALAIMQLAHRVDWNSKPQLTQDFYIDLFKKGVPWKAEEVKCVSKGDDCCEVVVSRV